MPELGFREERLDPHLPFAHRLLVGLGHVVVTHFVEVLLGEGAVDDAAVVAGGGVAAWRVLSRKTPLGAGFPSGWSGIVAVADACHEE